MLYKTYPASLRIHLSENAWCIIDRMYEHIPVLLLMGFHFDMAELCFQTRLSKWVESVVGQKSTTRSDF